jgi:hypothetical protein
MLHPYFEEWKAMEEARRLADIDRHAWKLNGDETPSAHRPGERNRGRAWRVGLRFASLRVCVSFRWGGHPER